MEVKKLTIAVLSLTIAALIAVTVLIPVVSDVTSTTDTFTNDGLYLMDTISSTDTDTVTLTWDHTKPKEITVNSITVSLAKIPDTWGITVPLIQTNSWFILYNKQTPTNIQLYTSTGWTKQASTSDNTDLSISMASGTASMTFGATSTSYNYTDGYYVSSTGSYTMMGANDYAYVLTTSAMAGVKNFSYEISGTATTCGVAVKGTYSALVCTGIGPASFTSSGVTFSNQTANGSEVTDHVNLKKVGSISFTATIGDNDTDSTMNNIIVPHQVIAERTIHVDNTLSTLIGIIPLLVIIALVIGAVAVIQLRK